MDKDIKIDEKGKDKAEHPTHKAKSAELLPNQEPVYFDAINGRNVSAMCGYGNHYPCTNQNCQDDCGHPLRT